MHKVATPSSRQLRRLPVSPSFLSFCLCLSEQCSSLAFARSVSLKLFCVYGQADGGDAANAGAFPDTQPEPMQPLADTKAMPSTQPHASTAMPSTQPQPIQPAALADPAAGAQPNPQNKGKPTVSVKLEPGAKCQARTAKAGKGKGSGTACATTARPAPTATPLAAPEPGSRTIEADQQEEEEEVMPSEADLAAIPPPPPKLTEGAIDRRLRRIVTPKANGKLKVPQEVVNQFNDKDERKSLQAAFEKVGYNPDPSAAQAFLLKCQQSPPMKPKPA